MPHWIVEPRQPTPKADVSAKDPDDLLKFVKNLQKYKIRDYELKDHSSVINIFRNGMLSHGERYGDIDLGIIWNNKRLQLTPAEHAAGYEAYVKWSCENDLAQIESYWGRPGTFFLVAEDIESNEVVGCVGIQPLAGYYDKYATALAHKLDSSEIPSEMDFFPETYAPAEPHAREAFISRCVTRREGSSLIYKECELRRMSVKDSCQGTGVAQLLLNHALKRAHKECGYNALHLTTSCTMRQAVRFYKKCGFNYIYITIDDTSNNSKLPICHMRWPFDDLGAKIKAFEDFPPPEVHREF
eukprot:GDKJ01058979.1.p1 GENE.GDKJ01058979.1~~GDKJ01058979.1.p1  ORF type:complete len:299 (-),score=29.26 GDKJ01058979.1:164-1060(-)